MIILHRLIIVGVAAMMRRMRMGGSSFRIISQAKLVRKMTTKIPILIGHI
jgi:hypothetical protein